MSERSEEVTADPAIQEGLQIVAIQIYCHRDGKNEMPVTYTEVPILSQFICVVQNTTGMPVVPNATTTSEAQQSAVSGQDRAQQQLPKGVVLDKDGKPCRTCMSLSSWRQMVKAQDPPSQNKLAIPSTTQSQELVDDSDCPADVETLGRSTWTFLHTMAANYPRAPSSLTQQKTKSFISLFSNMYPCSHCAEDFKEWMDQGNAPRVGNRDEFGRWMCEAHNAVNEKLGKERFDCNKWEERWRTGPPDGHCG